MTIKERFPFLNNPAFFSPVYYKLLILVIISYLWYINFEFIESHNNIKNIFFLAFNYFFLNVIFNFIRLSFTYFYIKKNSFSKGHVDNFIVGVERLSFFLNHSIFFLIFIDVIIVDLGSLLTTLSIAAAAVVLAFKEYILNFLSGINLMFSKDFRIKDTVKFGDTKGKIINFTFQNVHLKNEFGDIIFVPNSLFMTKEITNLSINSLKNIFVEVNILREDLDKFEKIKNTIKKDLFGKYRENIQNLDNILIYLNKIEKEIILITFEIYFPKYSLVNEKEVKSEILSNIALNFPNKKLKSK